MKHVIYLIFLLCISLSFQAQVVNDNSSVFYFIRHAEKDTSNSAEKDPQLTIEGVLRAAKWSFVFEEVKFDNVFSTNYIRTRETAMPTAEKNGLPLTLFDPNTFDPTAFIENNIGKTVLVVGHSNTTPAMVNALIGTPKYEPLNDQSYSKLFIVVINGSNVILDQVLDIE
jgi:broad specificity phosphatase PhoE